MSISTVTPANLITTARTAAPNAASSTANPYDSGNITTWQLPGFPTQKLVNGTQSFSTTQGQVFTDFASGQIVEAPGTTPSGQQTYALQAGNPPQND
jgi:hypothetical protein